MELAAGATGHPAINNPDNGKPIASTLLDIHNSIQDGKAQLLSITKVNSETSSEHYLLLKLKQVD